MELLIVLVLVSLIVMCGAVAYRMWQTGRAVAEFRTLVPGLVGGLLATRAAEMAEQFASRVGEPPEQVDPAHR